MPQKKNPDALELIRGKSAGIVASATHRRVTLKGLPLAYKEGMEERSNRISSSADQCSAMLRVATGFMSAVGLNSRAMRAAASTGFMNAHGGSRISGKAGTPFRTAHEQIGAAVQLCVKKGCEFRT